MLNNITSVAIKLIISGSHDTITHLAPPLGLVLCIKTNYFKFLENPLNKDTSIYIKDAFHFPDGARLRGVPL